MLIQQWLLWGIRFQDGCTAAIGGVAHTFPGAPLAALIRDVMSIIKLRLLCVAASCGCGVIAQLRHLAQYVLPVS
jgi:hypothetical protein